MQFIAPYIKKLFYKYLVKVIKNLILFYKKSCDYVFEKLIILIL